MWAAIIAIVLAIISKMCGKKDQQDEANKEASGETDSWFGGAWDVISDVAGSIGGTIADAVTDTKYVCSFCGYESTTTFTVCPRCGAAFSATEQSELNWASMYAATLAGTTLIGGADAGQALIEDVNTVASVTAEGLASAPVAAATGAAKGLFSEPWVIFAAIGLGLWFLLSSGSDEQEGVTI